MKRAIIDVLNGLEVIEQNGGEDAYILVENSKENHIVLNQVGLSSETINKYVNDGAFCILDLACGEGLASLYIDGKLIPSDDCLELPTNKEGVSFIFYNHEGETYFIISENGSIQKTKLSKDNIDGIKVILNS